MEYVTFEWKDNGRHLALTRKKMHGYWHLPFEAHNTDAATLWEVMPTNETHMSDPVVRVRCQADNSIWRKSSGSDWVLSAADENSAEDNRYSLFAWIKVGVDTVSLLCLGNNRYLKAAKGDNYVPNGLIATEATNASELCKFRVNVELPKYVRFVWNDNMSLARKEMHGYWHLPFQENIDDSEIWEVIPTGEKYLSAHVVRIRRSDTDNTFWRKSTGSDWVLSGPDVPATDRNSLFAWVKVDAKTVSLLCLGNNRYVKAEKGSTYAPNALNATEDNNNNDLCKFQVK